MDDLERISLCFNSVDMDKDLIGSDEGSRTNCSASGRSLWLYCVEESKPSLTASEVSIESEDDDVEDENEDIDDEEGGDLK